MGSCLHGIKLQPIVEVIIMVLSPCEFAVAALAQQHLMMWWPAAQTAIKLQFSTRKCLGLFEYNCTTCRCAVTGYAMFITEPVTLLHLASAKIECGNWACSWEVFHLWSQSSAPALGASAWLPGLEREEFERMIDALRVSTQVWITKQASHMNAVEALVWKPLPA